MTVVQTNIQYLQSLHTAPRTALDLLCVILDLQVIVLIETQLGAEIPPPLPNLKMASKTAP